MLAIPAGAGCGLNLVALGPISRGWARAHARLLEHFALQAADLPLLSMNPFRPADPFELLVPEGCGP